MPRHIRLLEAIEVVESFRESLRRGNVDGLRAVVERVQ